jgi:peptide-methionine (S)-S-oxide reductase
MSTSPEAPLRVWRILAVVLIGALLMAMMGYFGSGGGREAHGAESGVLPKPSVELQSEKNVKEGEKRTAVLANGCFWCTEAVFDQLEGVHDVVSGYAGGTKETANYKAVCTGRTGHAEAVRVTYEPAKISYAQLLRVFFATHDPTTKDQQGPDHGPQYRSAIFYENDEQKRVAEAYVRQLNEAKSFPAPIVTTLEPLKPDGFYEAELYHQDYAACNASNPYIRAQAIPKVKKVREQFKENLKKDQPAAKDE